MSDFSVNELAEDVRKAIAAIKAKPTLQKSGVVTRVSDGVIWVFGLKDCGYSEMVEVDTVDGSTISAYVLHLGEDEIGAVLLGGDVVKAGAAVRLSGKVLEIPVGPELIGRVIDPLGNPLDGKGAIGAKSTSRIERSAPSVKDRKGVHEPLMTGIMAIDAMVPIGRGQRELIIGDRQTGKTAVLIDTMINQHRTASGVINIYVAIGQKLSKIARLVERLTKEGVMEQTIVVVTSAADPASLQYLAPYAGATIGEYFRDHKQHALVMYDDLSKHAVAYRQMSLLLRRPPGREAYPGDVFYLHSRLLERAAKLNDDLGGGSLTALPVIETQAGDISAYIPTNVISITDGQIFMESNLFYQGIRPAISVGLSVSRVGSAAQLPSVKSASRSLRLDLAQFRELAAFTQFSTDLDDETRSKIERGQRLTELLKQPQYSPYSAWQMFILLLVSTEGLLDEVPVNKIHAAADSIIRELDNHHKAMLDRISEGAEPDDEMKEIITRTANKIAATYQVKRGAITSGDQK